MQKTTIKHTKSLTRIPNHTGILSPEKRLAIVQQTRGTWKRPLKQSLKTLASIRRGWDRKLDW